MDHIDRKSSQARATARGWSVHSRLPREPDPRSHGELLGQVFIAVSALSLAELEAPAISFRIPPRHC